MYTEASADEHVATPQNTGSILVAPDRRLLFCIIISLFFLWAVANNLNDVLIKQFQKALELSRTESGFVQTAFYFGYFCFALPAGWVVGRLGYKSALIVGLMLFGIGAIAFYPAAEVRTFGFFLAALYTIAAGLAFLETAANPLIVALGPVDTAARRLNLAQSFNGLGGFISPFVGSWLILSGNEHAAGASSSGTAVSHEAFLTAEAQAVQLPYVLLALTVFAVAIAVSFASFPQLDRMPPAASTDRQTRLRQVVTCIPFRMSVVAQFFYVGAQVSIWSYYINIAQESTGVDERTAARLLGASLFLFMVGRFAGTWLLGKISAKQLLVASSVISMALCGIAAVAPGYFGLVSLSLTSLFMSIMFPTIFATGVSSLPAHRNLGSSLIIMAIIGGAIIPPIVGLVGETLGRTALGLIVPAGCFAVVLYYAGVIVKN